MYASQVVFSLLVVFIAGVLLGSFFVLSQTILMVISLVALLTIAVAWRSYWRIVYCGFVVLFLSFGLLRINSFTTSHHILTQFTRESADVLINKTNYQDKVIMLGYVSRPPEAKGDQQSLAVMMNTVAINGLAVNVHEPVLITTGSSPQFSYGQKLRIKGELRLPQNTPGSSFDYKNYLAKDDIYTVMLNPDMTSINFPLSRTEQWKIAFLSVCFQIKDRFETALNGSIAQPDGGFVDGVLLGNKAGISSSLQDAFKRTGTTHILAVSGFNITIIASVVSSLLVLVMRRPKAFWFSSGVIIVFSIMTGAEASVVRAAIMGIVLLFAQREGRLYEARNAILLAAAIMIVLQPQILRYDVGFQLSFGATLGLIYIMPLIERYFKKIPEFFSLRENVVMTLSAQVFVLPLLLYYFQAFSIISVPVNVIVLPLIPYLMLFGFVAGIVGVIYLPAGRTVGFLATALSKFILNIIQVASNHRWALIPLSISGYEVVGLYFIIVALVAWTVKIKPLR